MGNSTYLAIKYAKKHELYFPREYSEKDWDLNCVTEVTTYPDYDQSVIINKEDVQFFNKSLFWKRFNLIKDEITVWDNIDPLLYEKFDTSMSKYDSFFMLINSTYDDNLNIIPYKTISLSNDFLDVSEPINIENETTYTVDFLPLIENNIVIESLNNNSENSAPQRRNLASSLYKLIIFSADDLNGNKRDFITYTVVNFGALSTDLSLKYTCFDDIDWWYPSSNSILKFLCVEPIADIFENYKTDDIDRCVYIKSVLDLAGVKKKYGSMNAVTYPVNCSDLGLEWEIKYFVTHSYDLRNFIDPFFMESDSFFIQKRYWFYLTNAVLINQLSSGSFFVKRVLYYFSTDKRFGEQFVIENFDYSTGTKKSMKDDNLETPFSLLEFIKSGVTNVASFWFTSKNELYEVNDIYCIENTIHLKNPVELFNFILITLKYKASYQKLANFDMYPKGEVLPISVVAEIVQTLAVREETKNMGSESSDNFFSQIGSDDDMDLDEKDINFDKMSSDDHPLRLRSAFV